jgi:hypothetical protein
MRLASSSLRPAIVPSQSAPAARCASARGTWRTLCMTEAAACVCDHQYPRCARVYQTSDRRAGWGEWGARRVWISQHSISILPTLYKIMGHTCRFMAL